MNAKMRRNKSISFDLTDKYEVELLAHAESDANGYFSKYIKRLISKDVDGRVQSPVMNNIEKAAVACDTKGDFSGFI